MFKIGFVGLDTIGQKMASHIMEKKGHPVMGYDDHEENRELFHCNGGVAVEDPFIIYENCNLILLKFSDTQILTKSIENILETKRRGLTIINFSKIAPTKTKEIKDKAKKLQIALFDVNIPEIGLTETLDFNRMSVRGEKTDYEKMTGFMKSIGKYFIYDGLIQDE